MGATGAVSEEPSHRRAGWKVSMGMNAGSGGTMSPAVLAATAVPKCGPSVSTVPMTPYIYIYIYIYTYFFSIHNEGQ
jgi:hypothetical protein